MIILLTILACIGFFAGAYYMGNWALDTQKDNLKERIMSTLFGIICWIMVGICIGICVFIYSVIISCPSR